MREVFNKTGFQKMPFSEIQLPHILGIIPKEEQVVTNPIDRKMYPGGSSEIIDDLQMRYGPIVMWQELEDDVFRLYLGTTEPLSYWAPGTAEITAILTLAKSIVPDDKKPRILDLECGTGLLSFTLARTGLVEVLATESNGTWLSANSPHFTHPTVTYLNEEPWSVAAKHSPRFRPETVLERIILINQMRKDLNSCGEYLQEALDTPIQENGEDGLDVWGKYVAQFRRKMELLQAQNRTFSTDSDIDLVICSFPPKGFDPTLLVRDVIYPKAIVYIADSQYDAFNFLITGERSNANYPESEVMGESYNPGINYNNLARWGTYCTQDWFWLHTSFPDTSGKLRGEIIVQTRKDVTLRKIKKDGFGNLPWEDELKGVRRQPPVRRLLKHLI